MIGKVCDRESRRDSWFEKRLVLFYGRSIHMCKVMINDIPVSYPLVWVSKKKVFHMWLNSMVYTCTVLTFISEGNFSFFIHGCTYIFVVYYFLVNE